jgi:hypothetical protein
VIDDKFATALGKDKSNVLKTIAPLLAYNANMVWGFSA